MTRELDPDNAGAWSHCVAANTLRALPKRFPVPVQNHL